MKKVLIPILAVLMLSMTLLTACGDKNADTKNTGADANKTTEPVELHVSAAASMTDVLQQIAEDYKAENENVSISFTFESSGALQTQIEEGADCDIFISAALTQMDALNEKGFIDETTMKNLLINKVVLITPTGNPAGIKSFEDVATDKVKMIAIGDPESVPVGEYTQTIYKNLGSWDTISAKATLDENVRAVLAHVESGDVDCGVVYATDAATSTGVDVICEAPEGSCDTVIYPAAVLSGSKNADAAKAFLAYLSSDKAVERLEAAGFNMYAE